jgi:hypothetical protein
MDYIRSSKNILLQSNIARFCFKSYDYHCICLFRWTLHCLLPVVLSSGCIRCSLRFLVALSFRIRASVCYFASAGKLSHTVTPKSLCWRYVNTVFVFLDVIHGPGFYFKRRFGDWIQSPSSGKEPTQLGPIDRATPYLRTPAPTQDRIFKPSAT